MSTKLKRMERFKLMRRGEAIERPPFAGEEALDCFLRTRMDRLVLDELIIERQVAG